MSKNLERFNQAGELDLRLERIIDLASLLGTDSMGDDRWSDQMEDLEADLECNKAFHGRAADLLPVLRCSEDAWAVAEALIDKRCFGILVQVATPVRTYLTRGSFSCSWGHYTTGWVYGETFEQAWEEAMDWATKRHSEMATKAAKGGAA